VWRKNRTCSQGQFGNKNNSIIVTLPCTLFDDYITPDITYNTLLNKYLDYVYYVVRFLKNFVGNNIV